MTRATRSCKNFVWAGATPAVTSHDQVETATEFCPSYFEGAYNPLIRRHFLGVFRFAQMALADVRTLTHAQGIKSYTKSTPIIEMAGTSQMASGTGGRRSCRRFVQPAGGAATSEQTAAVGHAHISARPASLVAERMDRLRLSHRDVRLHSTDRRYTLAGSLNATKRRPCLWITKRCLGTWNAKT